MPRAAALARPLTPLQCRLSRYVRGRTITAIVRPYVPLLVPARLCSSLLSLLRSFWLCWPGRVGGCRRVEGGCESGWGPPAVRLNRQWSAAGGPQPDGPPPFAGFCRLTPTYTCPLRRAASCFNRGAISSRKTASGIDDDGPLQLIASHRFCLTSRNGTATAFTPSCQSRNE